MNIIVLTRRAVGGAAAAWAVGVASSSDMLEGKRPICGKKTGKSPKTGAYIPSLVVSFKFLKFILEKRQNSLTILYFPAKRKHNDEQRAWASHVTL